MSTEMQRREVLFDFTVIVGSRPLFEDSDGPVYGDYNPETDRMYYGRLSKTGFIPSGDVKYDYYSSIYKNVDNLIDEAKRWILRNGNLEKREPVTNCNQLGNAAKLREVLKSCVDEMCDRCRELSAARGNPLPCLNVCEPVRKAKFALAAPRLNCEVGTVEEQAQRFNDYCHKQGNSCCIGRSKGACPMFKGYKVDCALVWAQMPYESEAAR